jgi:membrane-bound lytic murein transglycosylase B
MPSDRMPSDPKMSSDRKVLPGRKALFDRKLTSQRAARLFLPLLGTILLGVLPAVAGASEAESAAGSSTTTAATTTAPAPSTAPSASSTTSTSASASTSVTMSTSSTATSSLSGSATTSAPLPGGAEPEVQTQAPQALQTPVGGRRHAHGKGHAAPTHAGAGAAHPNTAGSHVRAPSPSALTPPSPFALGSSLTGVPSLFIANFDIPPFLLPIYQAAGSAYGIPWQVLAAINEVETDFGRDLSLSSAGAEGWMQFLPSSWAQYGVDASGNGYADPYNPADAIFAAARYLRAAGGQRHIRTAIFAYNHSQSYVESVMLRVQLLRATPAQLLQSLTALAEARFPVHAPSHFTDGFPAVPGHPGRSLTATAIDSSPAAPVIAVQDGTIAAIGHSQALGRYVVLRDAYGDEYTYGHLGSVATFYPVLTPDHRRARRVRSARAAAAATAAASSAVAVRQIPIPAASAGVQPRSPFTAAGVSSGLAFGAAAMLESLPTSPTVPAALAHRTHARRHSPTVPHAFTFKHEEVHLRLLRVGAHVIAGTVLGHLEVAAASPSEGELIFQIRPAGVAAPLIDPKPILDAWVSLGNSLAFRAIGRHRFPAAPGSSVPSGSSSTSSTSGSSAAVALSSTTVVAPTGGATHGHKPPSPSLVAAAPLAAAAQASSSELTPAQWLQLIARLGAIPDPVVQATPSSAAIADGAGQAAEGQTSEGQTVAEGQATAGQAGETRVGEGQTNLAPGEGQVDGYH